MNVTSLIQAPQLSVGKISAVIAAATFLLQLVLPNLIPILALGLLAENHQTITATGATWSRIATILHSSLWPTILQPACISSAGVPRRVGFVAWATPIARTLLVIAGVVTPLGLYESIVASKSSEPTHFAYARDMSGTGSGTPPRSSLGFNRICGGYPFWACPGKVLNVSESNYTEDTSWLANDIRIPRAVDDLFTSGLESFNITMSSIFDIQWRIYDVKRDPIGRINNGTEYLTGAYRHLAEFLLNDKIELVEGLIVDTHNGGIGFRNHSVPREATLYGSTWSEDILFIVPETQCVDTNLTIEYPTPGMDNLAPIPVLTDRGGFSGIERKFDWRDMAPLHDDTQDTLDLNARAYTGAWINNVLTMMYLNVTNNATRGPNLFKYINSSLGAQFPLLTSHYSGNESSYILTTGEGIHSTDGYGSYLYLPTENQKDWYKNPYNVTWIDFYAHASLCRGQGGGDFANITHISVFCGLVVGTGWPLHSPDSRDAIHPPGTNWTQPIYSCASATKAVVKTVTFNYNGSRGLSDLKVLQIADKTYSSAGDKPLWAVENVRRNLSTYDPLWGISNTTYTGHANVSTLRKESLWLPGFSGSTFIQSSDSQQNIPGAKFYTLAMGQAYSSGWAHESYDYAGKANHALYQRWYELSRSGEGTAHILNLIWTDVAANGVVGTRGWASPRRVVADRRTQEVASNNTVLVPVYSYGPKVSFRYIYGVPAFMVVATTVALGLATAITGIRRRIGIRVLRKYVDHTSFGMSVVSLLYPDAFSFSATIANKDWVPAGSGREVVVGGERPQVPKSRGDTANSSHS